MFYGVLDIQLMLSHHVNVISLQILSNAAEDPYLFEIFTDDPDCHIGIWSPFD